jgi:hypothetical protein
MKARQRRKIAEIGDALRAVGHVCLDHQPKALGLCRSTTWTILQASHKHSGLTAGVVSRMLKAPLLPSAVETKLIEYAEEKAAGLYGHSAKVRRTFAESLGLSVSQHRTDPARRIRNDRTTVQELR